MIVNEAINNLQGTSDHRDRIDETWLKYENVYRIETSSFRE